MIKVQELNPNGIIKEETALAIAKLITETFRENPQLMEEFERWKKSEEGKEILTRLA